MDDKYGTSIDETIEYYNQNTKIFIDSTKDVDMTSLYDAFEKIITPGGKILDLGCGSGRDSKYFSERGYDVVAIDPSSAMCEKASAYARVPVFKMKAEEIHFSDEFDAVWACSSLLHIPRNKHITVFRLISAALKKNGVFYGSWKYGNQERVVEGRFFTDMNEELLRDVINKVSILKEVMIWTSQDVRNYRKNQKWINALIKKNSN